MEMGPFFEEYPWLLIPIVIVIVEAWAAAKAAVRLTLRRQAADRIRPS
jgi:hypothetical protein